MILWYSPFSHTFRKSHSMFIQFRSVSRKCFEFITSFAVLILTMKQYFQKPFLITLLYSALYSLSLHLFDCLKWPILRFWQSKKENFAELDVSRQSYLGVGKRCIVFCHNPFIFVVGLFIPFSLGSFNVYKLPWTVIDIIRVLKLY